MTGTKIAISSLALDLKRVALGYWKGSDKTAQRFAEEALKRHGDLKTANLKPYLRNLLNKLPAILEQKDKKHLAEDALMYSTICQNYALKFA